MRGPRAKIKRAKKHVHELRGVHNRFAESEPYDLIAEDDGVNLTQHVVIRAEPPIELSLILGDALHNMRSALDLVFCQLVEANNLIVACGDSFPVHATRDRYEPGGKRQIKARVSPEAFEIIDSLNPYRGGNDALWTLHKLDIVDKHRTILTAAAAFGQLLYRHNPTPEEAAFLGVGLSDMPELIIPINPAEKLCPLKDGDLVFSAPAEDFERYEGTKVLIDVAIHEPGIVESEPLGPFVTDLSSTIEKTVELFASLLTK